MATKHDAPSIDEIETALSYVPSDDRDIWVKMAFAVRDELGDAGFTIWDRWSQSADSYSAKAASSTWKSAGGRGVTIASLMQAAREFGYRRSGEQQSISDDEYQQRKAQREADAAARKVEQDEMHARASDRAKRIYDSASPATSHPYSDRKGITLRESIRVGDWSRTCRDTGELHTISNTLIIPIRNARNRGPVTLQAYFPDANNPLGRDRDYLPCGEKSGGFFPLLPLKKTHDGVIVICEGWATGEAIHAATGHQVIVAFDAGNLVHVAESIRTMYPDNSIVIAADDDKHHMPPKRNAGMLSAVDAAKACGGLVAVPSFVVNTGNPTDFDDMARINGADDVAEAIDAAIDPDLVDTRVQAMRRKPAPATYDAEPAAESVARTHAPASTAIVKRYDLNAVDWYGEFVDVNGKGKPLETISNVEEALSRLGVVVRYNIVSKDVEIIIPGEGYTVDNSANASMAWIMSAMVKFGIPCGKLQDYLCNIADRNQYNPVATWITSKPWDGSGRLAEFIETVKADGEETGNPLCRVWMLKHAMIKRWMLSAVAASFNPQGVSAHGVLVFQGAQNIGKTHWFKNLVPADLCLTKDGLNIRPDDRDSVKKVISYWLVELGELDSTFRKADIAALKAFITQDSDVMRRAYARGESKYARRTVFFASVNPRQFLHDPTGNRRYWTISCAGINHEHGIDMQQVWAEVYENHYQRGESWMLSDSEMAMLNEHNEDYEVLDPIEERISTRMDWDAPEADWDWYTATDILHKIGFDRPTRVDVTRCGQLITKRNGDMRKKSHGARVIFAPPLVLSTGFSS